MDMKELMSEFDKRFKSSVDEHQRAMDKAVKQYELSLQKARDEFKQIAEDVHGRNKKPPANEHQSPPTAAWIEAPDGEQLLVLNKQASIMLLAVLGRMAEVTQELQKQSR